MDKVFGNFLPGKKLDCLVVDVSEPTGPIDVFPDETITNHFEKFLYLGDDRNIRVVMVDGRIVINDTVTSSATADSTSVESAR
jgi:guanine deaminase